MQLTSILKPSRTFCNAPGLSKKRVLENIAEFIGDTNSTLEAGDIFKRLVERERLGSTGIGNGIAIPHCRMPNCSSVIGTLVSLKQPIDFEAIDGVDVNLVFVLLVPEESFNDHLQTLAMLAELFNEPRFCKQLRAAKDAQELYDAAINFKG